MSKLLSNNTTHYIEIVVGPPHHKGQVIKEEDLLDFVRKRFGKQVYTSYYRFDLDGVKHIKKNSSPSGFRGAYYPGPIVLDIDDEDLESAHQLASNTLRQLFELDVPTEAIECWFSGGKGFHLSLDHRLFGFRATSFLPEQVKATIEGLFPHADLNPLSRTGLIRAPWSYHTKAGRFKIPLTSYELLNTSIEEIIEWSEKPMGHRKGFEFEPLESLPEQVLKVYVKDDESITPAHEAAEEKKPSYVTCMWKLFKRGPKKGRRHQDLLRLMASWASRGLAYNQLVGLAMQWLDVDELPDKDVKDMALRATGLHPSKPGERWNRYRCSDKVMHEHCDSKCVFFASRNNKPLLTDSSQRLDALKKMLSITEDQVLNLNVVYEGANYRILPGEVAMLIGDTGIGKSSWLSNIMVHLSDWTVVDLSTEMNMGLQTMRYIQIKHGLRVDEKGGIHEVDEAAQRGELSTLEKSVSHIRTLVDAPRLGDLEEIVRDSQCRLLVVDPIEKILKSQPMSDLEHIANVMRTLKDLARRYEIVVFGVNHVNKAAQKKQGLPLTLADSKGIKVVTEESNHVFAFEGTRFSDRRRVRLLKATRHQKLAPINLVGDVLTYQFRTEKIHEKLPN